MLQLVTFKFSPKKKKSVKGKNDPKEATGWLLSPILFAIFIDGLANAIKQVQVGFVLDGVKLNILLFADDVVLLAESKQGLQKLLDAAFEYSELWLFKWNCAKSKVMRFGLKSKACGDYLLGAHKLEVVRLFKYLGVDLQQNLTWTSTKWRFAGKARSRVPMVTKAVIEGLSVKAGEKLWATMIRPTLEYGAEIWGGGKWPQADRIQNKVGRTLLGLFQSTAVEVARGELGWLSLKARRDIKQLKYWGRLLKMADSRLVKKVYTYCKDYTATQKGSFCYSVKNILGQLNLGHLWVSEQVGESKEWVSLVMASVRQKDAEAWQLALQKKEKLRVYRTLKFNLKQEEYISWSLPAEHMSHFAKLRSGSHQLRVEKGRWKKEQEEDRVCLVCLTGKVENELHFRLDGDVSNRLRQNLYQRVKQSTGYDLDVVREDRDWMLAVMLGAGVPEKESRHPIGKLVAAFIAAAMKLRARILAPFAAE